MGDPLGILDPLGIFRKGAERKVKDYVRKPEIKDLYSAIKVSGQAIDVASKTVDFLSKPAVKDFLTKRLPAIASKLGKLSQFAVLLGPAGIAVSIAVDLLSAFGLLIESDPVMDKLNEIGRQIEGLQDDIDKGFKELKNKLDKNLVLSQFLSVYDDMTAQVEIYEENVKKYRGKELYKRLEPMSKSYPPDKIIKELRKMHNMIAGKGQFVDPLFQVLAKEMAEYEGDEFDQFMAILFTQFQIVIALEVRAVRMLRSFLVLTEEDLQYPDDIQAIFQNLGTQRSECDPLPIFEWYLDFKFNGGKFEMKALNPDYFVYMKSGNHRIRGYKTEPGPQGHFKIDPYNNGAFRVSCKYFPGEFMLLESSEEESQILSTTDINDLRCQWLFHIIDMEEKVFKLCTVKWPGRYVYMQDYSSYNVNVADDVKKCGKQAMFKLMPFDWVRE